MAIQLFIRDSSGEKEIRTVAELSDTGGAGSAIISSRLGTADIHQTAVTNLSFASDLRVDSGWARAGNVFTFTGTPDHLEFNFNIYARDTGASNYWARPALEVLKNGVRDFVIDDLAMQQNTAYSGDVTYTGVYTDVVPGENPSYTFRWFNEENRTATLTPENFSKITGKAYL